MPIDSNQNMWGKVACGRMCVFCVMYGANAGEGEAELADFTPAFLWLLRDFYLQLEEEGRQVNNPHQAQPSNPLVCEYLSLCLSF